MRGKAIRETKSIPAVPFARQVNQRRGRRPQQHRSVRGSGCRWKRRMSWGGIVRTVAAGGDGVTLRDVVGDGEGVGVGEGEGEGEGEDLAGLFNEYREPLGNDEHLLLPSTTLCNDENDADLG